MQVGHLVIRGSVVRHSCIIQTQNTLTSYDLYTIIIEHTVVTVGYAADQTIVAVLDASLMIRSSNFRMVCGPLLRALLPTDRKALLYCEKQKSNLMPHQFNVTLVAALK